MVLQRKFLEFGGTINVDITVKTKLLKEMN